VGTHLRVCQWFWCYHNNYRDPKKLCPYCEEEEDSGDSNLHPALCNPPRDRYSPE
jgi:hypothetical protein